MVDTYTCIDCEETLEIKEFYTDTSKRGFTKRCKVCFDNYVVYKEDKENRCNWCFGYGVFPHDGKPLGIHEVKQLFPARDCKVCGANYESKKRSVIGEGSNPHYPW